MATIRGAEAIGMADRLGSLEVGKSADVVVHHAGAAGFVPRGDTALQLVWGTDGRSVRHVLVAGRWVVADGRCVGVDSEALRVEAAERGRSLLARAGLAVPHHWPHIDAR
jgi:5-methylthioadenosine/S-adenosylhomocysteine deaminase